ncbi:Nucleic acid-binding, OB-fold [Sesbania bispinosa]|nr:Nucleic acid-binding, OB-fold [Sesbania bispinosa]
MALVSAGFHSISSLCGRKENWRLKVKVMRVWNMSAIATPNDPFAMQILFLDEEGGLIEGTVQKQNMQRFAQIIVEDRVYKITNFNGIKNDFMGILTAVSEEISWVKGAIQKRLTLLHLVDEILAVHEIETDLGEYPSEIGALVGKEMLFHVERKDDALINLDDSFKVKNICTDPTIINEFKDELKFAPTFSKLVDNETKSSVIDLSPHSSSATTEVDVTPKSY